MVNVDVSPSVVLGVGLIGAGVSLWQIRRVKPWISRDFDVVVSCISLLVGGILIFQGWRLDPLLLFGQLLTTSMALSFAIETMKLRSDMYEGEEAAELQDVYQRKGPGGGGAGGSYQLPPPPPAGAAQPWQQEAAQPWADPGQAGFYDYQAPQAQAAPVASGSGYAGYDPQQPQGQQQWDYGSGAYQPAEYASPPDSGTAGSGGFYAAGDGGSGGGAGSSGGAAAPTEFTFPASYSDPAAGAWAPGQQPQQPQQPQAGGGSGQAKPYDNMDDW